jgi:hypothetical protein
MPGQIPNIVRLYRIVHIDNVAYLLENGIYAHTHENADPNYINIGDANLIAQRKEYPVGINPPNGTLGEYVPFYFGPLSPMLLNIKTGHRGITKRPQSDIVYICCYVDTVIDKCPEWCFTNGHAKNILTEFYNDISHLGEVDWNIVGERYWNDTEEDFDRMRRKQAEFLVKNHVPNFCIVGIIVANDHKKDVVQQMIEKAGLNIKIHVDSKNNFYY